jgi:hypothetical protein
MPDPIRLTDNDPQRLAVAIVGYVTARAFRDARRLGLVLKTADGRGEQDGTPFIVMGSEIYRAALMLAEWAKTGRGDSAEIAAAILQVRADLEGIDIMQASPTRPLDPATLHGAVLVAAGARLALVEGRTVTAIELAMLANVDEHSVRAAVKARTLRALEGSTRPMRFAADLAQAYLYTRGVPGFAAPQAPPA